MARSIMEGKNLPKYLWAEDVATIVYILKRSPTKVVWDMTTYEAWFKRKPNIEFRNTSRFN